jgi:hypothetical protein
MEKAFEILELNVLNQISRDIMSGNTDDVKRILLETYNAYQENERDGVDYIFDACNQEDMEFLVYDRKMPDEHFAILVLGTILGNMQYFFYGCNHPEPKLMTELEFHTQIVSYVSEYLPYVLAYPQCYKEFYQRFVAPCFVSIF